MWNGVWNHVKRENGIVGNGVWNHAEWRIGIPRVCGFHFWRPFGNQRSLVFSVSDNPCMSVGVGGCEGVSGCGLNLSSSRV